MDRSRSWQRVHALALMAIISAALPSTAGAQTPESAFASMAAQVKPGDTIWVTTSTKRDTKGRLADLSDTTLTIASDGSRTDFAVADVLRVSREHADPKWNGAAIGAGIALFPALWYCSQQYESGETCGEGITALTIIGAIGAGIGAAVDAQVKGRATIYERPVAASVTRHGAGTIAVSHVIQNGGDEPGLFGAGWNMTLAARLRRSWQLAGEVGRSYRDTVVPTFLTGSRQTLQTIMIGARWSRQAHATATFFAQGLAGEVRLSSRVTSCGVFESSACSRSIGDTSVDSRFAIQPGAGIDVRLWRSTSVRAQGDYRLLFGRGPTHGVRLATGLAVAF